MDFKGELTGKPHKTTILLSPLDKDTPTSALKLKMLLLKGGFWIEHQAYTGVSQRVHLLRWASFWFPFKYRLKGGGDPPCSQTPAFLPLIEMMEHNYDLGLTIDQKHLASLLLTDMYVISIVSGLLGGHHFHKD